MEKQELTRAHLVTSKLVNVSMLLGMNPFLEVDAPAPAIVLLGNDLCRTCALQPTECSSFDNRCLTARKP